MDEPIDVLKIKIDKARSELSADTLQAIDAVDWRAAILGLRASKGYTFEQLGDLETETELVLCGLVSPDDYPREIERRMGITKIQANELINDMNIQVFSRIKEEMIKNAERKLIFDKKPKIEEVIERKIPVASVIKTPSLAEIKINLPNLKIPELPAGTIKTQEPTPMPQKIEIKKELPSILSQKFSTSFKSETKKTEHTLDNLTKIKIPKADPYRELPE